MAEQERTRGRDAETAALKGRRRVSRTTDEERRGTGVWDGEEKRGGKTRKKSDGERDQTKRNAGKLETAKWRGVERLEIEREKFTWRRRRKRRKAGGERETEGEFPKTTVDCI